MSCNPGRAQNLRVQLTAYAKIACCNRSMSHILRVQPEWSALVTLSRKSSTVLFDEMIDPV
jgi:hypothetical protein